VVGRAGAFMTVTLRYVTVGGCCQVACSLPSLFRHLRYLQTALTIRVYCGTLHRVPGIGVTRWLFCCYYGDGVFAFLIPRHGVLRRTDVGTFGLSFRAVIVLQRYVHRCYRRAVFVLTRVYTYATPVIVVLGPTRSLLTWIYLRIFAG